MTKELSSDFPPGGQVSLWAYDSVGDKWYAVLGDEDGHLQLDVVASALPTGAATAAKQLANDHDVNVSNMISGFATSAKQLPDGHNVTVDNATLAVLSGDDKIFAFESIAEEAKSDLNLGSGSVSLAGTQVPSGKVWKITAITVRYDGTVPTSVSLVASGLGGNLTFMIQDDPVSGRWYPWNGEIYFQAGDYVQANVVGATAGDSLYLRYAGVQMDAP